MLDALSHGRAVRQPRPHDAPSRRPSVRPGGCLAVGCAGLGAGTTTFATAPPFSQPFRSASTTFVTLPNSSGALRQQPERVRLLVVGSEADEPEP